MARMKRDDARLLLQPVRGDIRPTGSRTSYHHGIDNLMAYVVRTATATVKGALEWEERGLFVSFDDFEKSPRDHVTVVYQMGDGTLLGIVLAKDDGRNLKRLTTFPVPGLFHGEEGVKVHLKHWRRLGNRDDFVLKAGERKVRHLARKPRRPVGV